MVRKEISERLKKICAELNLKLIELETNLRSLYKNFNIHWELAHGNALGAFVHFLDNYFKKVYIPATFYYKDFFLGVHIQRLITYGVLQNWKFFMMDGN